MSATPVTPARADLEAALGVRRWVDDVLAGAPYADLDALLAAVRAAATPLSPDEVAEALAHHPRIGERPVGEGAAQDHSRREQRAPDADDPDLAARLAAGNAAYEHRFGRVFLVRAAGRTRAEVLAELDRRLTLDAAAELDEVAEQLRQIALGRLRAVHAGGAPVGQVTTHVLDAARGRPAVGVAVTLVGPDGAVLGTARTDDDGRVRGFGGFGTAAPTALTVGEHRLELDTGAWFAAQGVEAFYPRVTVHFTVSDPSAHLHVPLLLSPFAYSTYRGT